MFKRIFRGRALYTESSRIWVARGMFFWAVDFDGKRISRRYRVGNIKQCIIAANRLSRQLLREGLHHLLPLHNGDILVTGKRKTYLVSESGKIKNIFKGYAGNKPGHQGVCLTSDGTIFFGEYTLNKKRDHDTKLFRSIDGGMSFECVLTLPRESVRHIHFVNYDHYEKCLWLGTGDEDFECKLYRSIDNGNTWEIVGEGNQDWRAIGVCFSKDSLFWGTDAGSVPDQNHLVRMNRLTHRLEIIADIEGPCHGCASFANGRIFLSTGVEGGLNESDRFARFKEIKDSTIIELFKVKKDIIPLILQYGIIRFPLGSSNCGKTVFTIMGLKHGGEVVMIS